MPRYHLFGTPAVPSGPEQFWTEALRRRRRHTMELMVVCLAGLVPWTIYLALTLPSGFRAHYWRLAWSGFDVMLLLAMTATAYLGWRQRQAVIASAIATATLLICDAWFDIALDLGTRDIWTSLASAAFIELPLAAFFLRRVQLIVRVTLARVLPDIADDAEPPSVFKIPMLGVALWEREAARGREPGPAGGAEPQPDPDGEREPEL